MNKSALSVLAVTKLNLISIIVPNVSTTTPLLSFIVMYIVINIIEFIFKIGYTSISTWLFMLVVLSAISLAGNDFYRVINLGGKRKTFFAGCMITYIILSFAVSVLNTVIFYTLDVFMKTSSGNLFKTFNWVSHGAVVGSVMQFAFLLFLSALIHTVFSMRLKLAAFVIFFIILFTFILVKPLLNAVSQFFELIFYRSDALEQIVLCLVLAAVIYAISLPVINRKNI